MEEKATSAPGGLRRLLSALVAVVAVVFGGGYAVSAVQGKPPTSVRPGHPEDVSDPRPPG